MTGTFQAGCSDPIAAVVYPVITVVGSELEVVIDIGQFLT